MPLTRDKAYRAGMALRRLMNDEAFDVAVDLLKEDYTSRILTSEYADAAGRETNYRRLVALNDLIGVMSTLAYAVEQEALLRDEDDEE